MGGVRRRLYISAWLLFAVLLALVWTLRGRLPERLPSLWEGAWTDRDAFFGVQFAVLGLILLFSVPIDRVLLRRTGDNAFLAAIALFMTVVFALILLPVLWVGLSAPRPILAWMSASATVLGVCATAYLLRMRTLRGEAVRESLEAAYYRKIRVGWFMAAFPLGLPFLPFSVAAKEEGIRVKGPLMDCRWKWGQVESVAAGKPVQAYTGMAIRLTASGREVVVVEIKDQKWPVVLNAPDREEFFSTVRRLAPHVSVGDAAKMSQRSNGVSA
jgi:hypothetical protein